MFDEPQHQEQVSIYINEDVSCWHHYISPSSFSSNEMTARSSVLLLFCWILRTTMGSEPDPSSLLSVTSLQQKVQRLEDKMSSMEDSLELMIRGENEQMLITVLDKMAKDSKNYASIDKVSEMGEALRGELRALLSPLLSRMQELEERIAKKMEDFESLVTCASEPPSPQNGKPVDFERKHGSEVGFTCDGNFVVTGNSTVRCHFGTWEGHPPVCIAVCGRAPLIQSPDDAPQSDHGKIVGGSDAQEGEYPWQVMLWEPSLGSYCGGALIDEWWVATAAYCLVNPRNISWDSLRLLLGKHGRLRGEESEVELRAAVPASFNVHPEFHASTFDNDIALVRLASPARFSPRVLPVCLGGRNETEALLAPGIVGTVTGWGRLKGFGAYPRYLQEVALPVVDQERCIASTQRRVTQNMFCAGYDQEVISDACEGFHGSPFVIKHEGRWYMVGVVSWGEGCGRKGKFGFYTRVTNYLSWIQGVIQP